MVHADVGARADHGGLCVAWLGQCAAGRHGDAALPAVHGHRAGAVVCRCVPAGLELRGGQCRRMVVRAGPVARRAVTGLGRGGGVFFAVLRPGHPHTAVPPARLAAIDRRTRYGGGCRRVSAGAEDRRVRSAALCFSAGAGCGTAMERVGGRFCGNRYFLRSAAGADADQPAAPAGLCRGQSYQCADNRPVYTQRARLPGRYHAVSEFRSGHRCVAVHDRLRVPSHTHAVIAAPGWPVRSHPRDRYRLPGGGPVDYRYAGHAGLRRGAPDDGSLYRALRRAGHHCRGTG